jgi:hypothetical protein
VTGRGNVNPDCRCGGGTAGVAAQSAQWCTMGAGLALRGGSCPEVALQRPLARATPGDPSNPMPIETEAGSSASQSSAITASHARLARNAWYRETLTRLLPDCDPGVGTLSRNAGERGPSPEGWVGEGLTPGSSIWFDCRAARGPESLTARRHELVGLVRPAPRPPRHRPAADPPAAAACAAVMAADEAPLR